MIYRVGFRGAAALPAIFLTLGMVAQANTESLGYQYSAVNGVKVFDFQASVPEEITGDLLIFLMSIGDFNDPDENYRVELDGRALGVYLDDDSSNDFGDLGSDRGEECEPQTVVISVPAEEIRDALADAAVHLRITTSSTVSGGCYIGQPGDVSAKFSATLSYTPVEHTHPDSSDDKTVKTGDDTEPTDPGSDKKTEEPVEKASLAEKDYVDPGDKAEGDEAYSTKQAELAAEAEKAAAEAAAEQKEREERLQETISSAATISASRTTTTLATLPALSGRLAGAGPAAPLGGGAPGNLPTSAPNAPMTGAGVAPTSGGGAISGAGNENRGFLAFSGDLASAQRAVARLDTESSSATLNVNDAANPVDLWFGGSYTYFRSELGGVRQSGDVATAQFGVDTRVSDRTLIGFAAFGDLILSDAELGSKTTGVGFMTGPYAVVSLTDNVYVEALGAWGRAYNRIEAADGRDSRYESDRLLLTGRVSGEWTQGAWTMRPSTRLTYYVEQQEAFADGSGGIAPERTTSLGQLRFGPEVGYDLQSKHVTARPFAGVEGVWAFQQTDQIVNGVALSGADLTTSVSWGVDGLVGRTSFRAGGRYDGLGDQAVTSVTGELTIRIPLQ